MYNQTERWVFNRHEVFTSTYQVLTKFYKVLTKSCFCFQKTGSEKHSILVKRKLQTVFNVLIFITETRPSELFSYFFNFNATYIRISKAYSLKSLFWNCKSPSPLKETKCLVSFLYLNLSQIIQTDVRLASALSGYFSQRRGSESSTKLSQAKTPKFGFRWANDRVLRKFIFYASVLLLVIKISQSAIKM